MNINFAFLVVIFQSVNLFLTDALRGERFTESRKLDHNTVEASSKIMVTKPPKYNGDASDNDAMMNTMSTSSKGKGGSGSKTTKSAKTLTRESKVSSTSGKSKKSTNSEGDEKEGSRPGRSDDCEEGYGCTLIELSLTLDEFPFETGYRLICDGEAIWDVPVGSYPPMDFQFATIKDETCIEAAEVCVFTIYDSYGDGITSVLEGKPGNLTVHVGDETEIEYNGTDDEADFDSISYPAFSIINDCDSENDDDLDDDATDSDDDQNDSTDDDDNDTSRLVDVILEMTMDEFPTETGYNLIFGSETIWNVTKGTFSASTPFLNVTEIAFVNSSDCCTFTVLDSITFGDGLTSPQEGQPGNFKVKYDGETVAEYDGSTDGGYTELNYDFGTC